MTFQMTEEVTSLMEISRLIENISTKRDSGASSVAEVDAFTKGVDVAHKIVREQLEMAKNKTYSHYIKISKDKKVYFNMPKTENAFEETIDNLMKQIDDGEEGSSITYHIEDEYLNLHIKYAYREVDIKFPIKENQDATVVNKPSKVEYELAKTILRINSFTYLDTETYGASILMAKNVVNDYENK